MQFLARAEGGHIVAYTNRMDLTYNYSASSGQMGVGSTCPTGAGRVKLQFSTSYESTTAGAKLTKMIYSSGQQVSVNRDDMGRMQSLMGAAGEN